ncbi:Fc.00g098370.m01.CDS01 [Cosmosporella sp. VM-42]
MDHQLNSALRGSVQNRRAALADRNQQVFQQNVQTQQVYGAAAAAPRSVVSPNWRTAPTGDMNNWMPTTPGNYTLTTTISRGEIFDGNLNGYAYCLNRGNGQFTRLIPADMLPAMVEIPARQSGPLGMVVLPALQTPPPQGIPEMNRPVTIKASGQGSDIIQKQIDRIVATSPLTQKKPKIYCDKWVHEGVCAFTQQGCKYKHEMPIDTATQHSLGLFHGFPPWWKKLQAEIQRRQEIEEPVLSPARPKALLGNSGNGASVDKRQMPQLNQQGWRKESGGGVKLHSPTTQAPPEAGSKRTDVLRPLSTNGSTRCVWGPIEPPQKPGYEPNPSFANSGSKSGGKRGSHSRQMSERN